MGWSSNIYWLNQNGPSGFLLPRLDSVIFLMRATLRTEGLSRPRAYEPGVFIPYKPEFAIPAQGQGARLFVEEMGKNVSVQYLLGRFLLYVYVACRSQTTFSTRKCSTGTKFFRT